MQLRFKRKHTGKPKSLNIIIGAIIIIALVLILYALGTIQF